MAAIRIGRGAARAAGFALALVAAFALAGCGTGGRRADLTGGGTATPAQPGSRVPTASTTPTAVVAPAPSPTALPIAITVGTPTAPSALPPPPPPAAPPPPSPAPAPPLTGAAASISGCRVFPADNAWNQDISAMPVDPNSATYIASINASGGNGFLHADFGSDPTYGIPYVLVPQDQPLVPITYTAYGDESDPGPFPIPLNARVEAGSDAHVIAVQLGACKLYELFDAHQSGAGWDAGSGAMFDLNSDALRPDSWTSADAAGLPIFAGLARYDEVQAGAINHALRFTMGRVRRAWVHPATHYGTTTSTAVLPYGAKLRLKASFDVSAYHGEARVILNALRRYGMIVADQGTSWFITGATDARWDDADLDQLKRVSGTAFEVVQLGTIHTP
jgi:hypothetical protein